MLTVQLIPTNTALQTGTGVAYSNLAKHKHQPSAPIMELQTWENRDEEGKVPTQRVYDRRNVGQGPIAWGFTEQGQPDSNHVYAKWFKVRFSSPIEQLQPDEKDLPPVDTLYEDFLSKLYGHIEEKLNITELEPLGKAWKSASIEFIFSFPATWDRPTVEKFKRLAKKARFGSHPRHSVKST